VSGGVVNLSSLRRHAIALVRTLPGRTALAVVLMIAAAFTEGVGLLTLIPLLELIGLDVGGGVMATVSTVVEGVLTRLGLRVDLAIVLPVYVGIVAGHALLTRWAAVVAASVSHQFAARVRADLHAAVVGASWSFHTRVRGAHVANVLTTEVARVVAATDALLTLVVRGATVIVYVALAIAVAPWLALLACLTGAGLFLAFQRQVRNVHAIGREIGDANAMLQSAVNERLAGIKVTKGHGVEERVVEAFTDLARHAASLYVTVYRVHANVGAAFRIASAVVLSALVYVALVVVGLTTAALLLMLFLFARLLPLMQGLQSSFQTFASSLPAFDEVVALQERCAAAAEQVSGRAWPSAVPVRGGVELESVGFAYEPGRPVLRDVTLRVAPGTTTAIVGASGSGKSTLADMILGLLTPERGVVRVDGVVLEPSLVRAWRERVGYVPQDAFLFHDSLRANLTIVRPHASHGELWGALETASVAAFVRSLPDGLDTVVGDRGVRLSGGERQRIALARALVRGPALLVLDEATSNLDAENEHRIQAAIDDLRGAMTILIIAHRLSTVRNADTIYVLEGGVVVERGAWDDLLAIEGGRLRRLCEEQGVVAPGRVARQP
jgi:ATP-binding cassette, subfamily C, bacterial